MKETIGNMYDTIPEYHIFEREIFIKNYVKMGINLQLSFSNKKTHVYDEEYSDFKSKINKIYINRCINKLKRSK